MSAEFDDQPFSESHLESPEYRERLMRKLNTLIAVLEVACSKVRRSLQGPEPDTERLNRIHKNLRDTLRVCTRAKQALERRERLPDDLPAHLRHAVADPTAMPPAAAASSGRVLGGNAIEMSSKEESEMFGRLGPIEPRELRDVDLDDLCRRLLD